MTWGGASLNGIFVAIALLTAMFSHSFGNELYL